MYTTRAHTYSPTNAVHFYKLCALVSDALLQTYRHIHMYVCMYIRLYVYLYSICMSECAKCLRATYANAEKYKNNFEHKSKIYLHTCLHTSVHMYVYVYVLFFVCAYVRMYVKVCANGFFKAME